MRGHLLDLLQTSRLSSATDNGKSRWRALRVPSMFGGGTRRNKTRLDGLFGRRIHRAVGVCKEKKKKKTLRCRIHKNNIVPALRAAERQNINSRVSIIWYPPACTVPNIGHV